MKEIDLRCVSIFDLARGARVDSDFVRAACRELGLEIHRRDMAEIVDASAAEKIMTRARELGEKGRAEALERIAKAPRGGVEIIPRAMTEPPAPRASRGGAMSIGPAE